MAIDLSGPVSQLVVTALNASVMRHEAIANNIANINTPGYKAQQVSFEDQLQRLMSSDMLKDDASLKSQLKNVQPFLYEVDAQSSVDGQSNRLDLEMVNMAKNTINYQALLKGLRGYGSIVKMAVKEGRS
jgi:flagellar basal-body rod protein FlgB